MSGEEVRNRKSSNSVKFIENVLKLTEFEDIFKASCFVSDEHGKKSDELRSALRYYSLKAGFGDHGCIDSPSRENEGKIINQTLRGMGLCKCSGRPIYVALLFGYDQLVRTMLMYGADVPMGDVCPCKSDSELETCHPAEHVISAIHASYSMLENGPIKERQRRKIDETIRWFLVDVPHWTGIWKMSSKVLNEVMMCPVIDSVPSLMHMCRTSIRISIKNNSGGLPFSIDRLRLPRILKEYLALSEFENW